MPKHRGKRLTKKPKSTYKDKSDEEHKLTKSATAINLVVLTLCLKLETCRGGLPLVIGFRLSKSPDLSSSITNSLSFSTSTVNGGGKSIPRGIATPKSYTQNPKITKMATSQVCVAAYFSADHELKIY